MSTATLPEPAAPPAEEPLYEVVNGQKVGLPPMGAQATMIASLLFGFLFPHVRGQRLGHLVSEMLFILDRDTESILGQLLYLDQYIGENTGLFTSVQRVVNGLFYSCEQGFLRVIESKQMAVFSKKFRYRDLALARCHLYSARATLRASACLDRSNISHSLISFRLLGAFL